MAKPLSASFKSTFTHALYVYKKRTGNDLFSHSLAVRLQTCEDARAIISVLQEQVRTTDQSESLAIWLSPTVNVLVAISLSVQEGIGLVSIGACSFDRVLHPYIFLKVLPPAKLILVGIGILLSVSGFPCLDGCRT